MKGAGRYDLRSNMGLFNELTALTEVLTPESARILTSTKKTLGRLGYQLLPWWLSQ